jgi:type II secretory pathway predicted ATPase ExeA
MYESHFGLRQRPFGSIPDSEAYYAATGHERALAQLLQAIQDAEGLALLTGEPGSGKTLLGHCLLDRLGEQVTSAFLTNSHFGTRTGLLQALLYDLALPYEGKSEQELRLVLTDTLLKTYEAGRRTVLVVDEAHHLTPDLLEELRLLSNMEGRRGKAIQIILLALPAIEQTLCLPELAGWRQRLGVQARLEPLGLHEAADYLVHGLRTAGGVSERIVADEALEILARGSRGVPRLLNRTMHQALQLAYTAGQDQVDAEVALEALAGVGLSNASESCSASASVATLDTEELESPREEEDLADERVRVVGAEAAQNDSHQGGSLADMGRARRLYVAPRRPA